MKGVRTMFGRLFLSTGSDTFAGAKAKSFAPSAPPYSIYDRLVLTITCTLPSSKNNEFFLRPRVTRQKKTSFFCAGGSRVKKKRVFSAPEAHASKKNGFFLRPRVTRQKKTDFFCAGGSSVKKKRVFSAPEGCKSKNDGRFLRRRVASQKIMDFFCAAGLQVQK